MSILFFQSLMNGLMLAGLYSLISAGVTLIFGVLHIINFAQGAFLMLGAYMLYYVLTFFGFDFYTSFVLAVLSVGGLAILTERYLYHRFWLHGAVLSCLVVSVGLTQVMQNGALLVFGIYEKNVDSVFSGAINIFRAPLFARAIHAHRVCLSHHRGADGLSQHLQAWAGHASRSAGL